MTGSAAQRWRCRLGRHIWAQRYDGRCDEWCCVYCRKWRSWDLPAPAKKDRHPNWQNFAPCCWNQSCPNVAGEAVNAE